MTKFSGREYRDWGDFTCLQLAEVGHENAFFAHPGVHQTLRFKNSTLILSKIQIVFKICMEKWTKSFKSLERKLCSSYHINKNCFLSQLGEESLLSIFQFNLSLISNSS